MAYIGNSQFRGVGVVTGGNIQDGSIESIDLATLTNIDVNGGSIDGAVIGANEAVAGNFSSIGIGTNSPNAGLQISKGADQSPPVAGSNTGAACFGNNTSSNAYGLVMGADGFGKGYISAQRTDGTATTYDLTVQPNGGNVGIGTTTPSTKLDVSGTITADSLALGNGSTISYNDTDGRIELNTHTQVSGVLQVLGNGVHPFAWGNTEEHARMSYSATSATIISRPSYDLVLGAAGSSVLYLNTNNNVGIGTGSPGAKLHVWNPNGGNATDKATMLSEAVVKLQPHSTNSTNLLVAQVNNGNGMGLQVTNSSATADWDIALSPFGGKVGIGVTTPAAQFNVSHAAHGIGMEYAAPTLPDLAGIYTSSDASHGQGYGTLIVQSRADYNGYGIAFRCSNQERMRIDGYSGKVGINTTAPLARLDVKGTSLVQRAHEDITLTSDSFGSTGEAGEITLVLQVNGTIPANCVLEFTYTAATWKSWMIEVTVANTMGFAHYVGGGYNNGGISGYLTEVADPNNNITSAAINTYSTQGNKFTFGLRQGGIHTTIKIKYAQGGGDGAPRADRCFVNVGAA